LSGFEAISKETILALVEVVEGGTELQKKNRVGVGRNRTPTTDYIKVNFEDLEKRKPALTLTEKKPKWKCYRQKLMRLKVRKDL
jgi:hypothetical protein